jgi:hypothetical protein
MAQHGDEGRGGAHNNGMVRVQDHVGHRPDGNAAFWGTKFCVKIIGNREDDFWGLIFI